MNTCSVTPASYNGAETHEEIRHAFHDGKDFILHDVTSPWDGKPCTEEELRSHYDQVKVRNRDKELVTVVTFD